MAWQPAASSLHELRNFFFQWPSSQQTVPSMNCTVLVAKLPSSSSKKLCNFFLPNLPAAWPIPPKNCVVFLPSLASHFFLKLIRFFLPSLLATWTISLKSCTVFSSRWARPHGQSLSIRIAHLPHPVTLAEFSSVVPRASILPRNLLSSPGHMHLKWSSIVVD